jgi:SAM-dependent methyltransferase
MTDHLDYDAIEEELNAYVGESLDPRGPDVLYDVLASLAVPPGAVAVDVGCGRGEHTVRVAERFGWQVLGIDPAPRHGARAAEGVTFRQAAAEAIPVDDASVDVLLYREVLYLVDDLPAVFAEARRALRPDGRAVVYQLFSTDRLEPREAERFWSSDIDRRNTDIGFFESAIERGGLVVEQLLDLQGETVEWAEEHHGKAAKEGLAASRLLRRPERYIERFGQEAYDIKLTDSLWFLYRLIGKLTQRAYVLRPSST